MVNPWLISFILPPRRRDKWTCRTSPDRHDRDRDLDAVAAGRDDDAIYRGDIGIVAADREQHMVAAGEDAVGRIEPDPARIRAAPGQRPGMHGVGAREPRLAGLLHGADVSADVSHRQAERS